MNEYFLGIDVSKGYADFMLLDSSKNVVVSNFQIDDTFDGHVKLFDVLSHFSQEHPDSMIFAGLESTGGYENNWYSKLKEFQKLFPIRVARLNPTGVSHIGKVEMNRNVTDKISAKNVALYLIQQGHKIEFEQESSFPGLKRLWTYLRMLKKQQTQLLNELDPLLYSAHPQLQHYCQEGMRQWILKLIIRYPTALHLSRARVETVSRIPYISAERSRELIFEAKSSIASATDDIMAGLIKSIAQKILELDKEIGRQEKILELNCDLPEVQLLTTIKGLGVYSAVGLMIEIGAIERFPDKKRIASFFGMHPELKISGDKIVYVGMSKKVRRVPREILFNVAKSAINTNPYIGQIYRGYVDNGKNKMAAIGIIMHKILRIIYGMLKTNTAFDCKVDRKNRRKEDYKQKAKTFQDQKRRYQSYDSKAPITRRQMKRRRAQMKFQNVFTLSTESSIALSQNKLKKIGV